MRELWKLLRCPVTGQELNFEPGKGINEGFLVTKDKEYKYSIVKGIPRFVSKSTYADNFGMQWNYFRKTQLDSHSGHPISSDRFWEATGWKSEDLKNKLVLDIGCGAGRFAEVALNAGAYVVALDYSSSVEACSSNLSQYSKLSVVQGDIYSLPFPIESFDYVYSLGVLQHTPDVFLAFSKLTLMVKPGGEICVDYYWKRFRTLMHSKYLFRPISKRLSEERLFKILKKIVPKMLILSNILGSVPIIGKALQRIIPVANYTGIFPLSKLQLEEWALLDTFDMLSPVYDKPQSERTVKKWWDIVGKFSNIEVFHAAHLVSRARKLPD